MHCLITWSAGTSIFPKLGHFLLFPSCRPIPCRFFYFLFLHFFSFAGLVPSVLWRCWLGGRKGIRPVKNWVVGAGMVICLERGADLHMFQLMPLPLTVSCFSKIQIGLAFLVPAHLGSPGKMAVKRVCVCVLGWFLSHFHFSIQPGSLWRWVSPFVQDKAACTFLHFSYITGCCCYCWMLEEMLYMWLCSQGFIEWFSVPFGWMPCQNSSSSWTLHQSSTHC